MHGDVRIPDQRGHLVDDVAGRTLHQVGMPWHWGYEGVSTGDIVNEMTALVGDPNVSMHEGKAFVCNVEKG
jgi:formate dehydrogenase major subunit